MKVQWQVVGTTNDEARTAKNARNAPNQAAWRQRQRHRGRISELLVWVKLGVDDEGEEFGALSSRPFPNGSGSTFWGKLRAAISCFDKTTGRRAIYAYDFDVLHQVCGRRRL
jgi:hypothetical protein